MSFESVWGTSAIQTLAVGVLWRSAWVGRPLLAGSSPSQRSDDAWPRWPRLEPKRFGGRSN
eukprot:7244609-Alexandrium_andersonii.AAC.1